MIPLSFYKFSISFRINCMKSRTTLMDCKKLLVYYKLLNRSYVKYIHTQISHQSWIVICLSNVFSWRAEILIPHKTPWFHSKHLINLTRYLRIPHSLYWLQRTGHSHSWSGRSAHKRSRGYWSPDRSGWSPSPPGWTAWPGSHPETCPHLLQV